MPIDLALNKPATASSVLNANSTPDLAFDNNQFTGWGPANVTSPQWISVDLGSVRSIGEIVLRWYQDMWPKAYVIEDSLDAMTWTTIYSTTTGSGNADLTGLSGTGRYVRLTATVPNASYYSLHDMFVYAATVQTGTRWGWRENFKNPAIFPWAKSYNVYACGDTTSPLGPVPPTPSGFYGLFTGPGVQDAFQSMASTSFGQQLDPRRRLRGRAIPALSRRLHAVSQVLLPRPNRPWSMGATARPDQDRFSAQL